MFVVVVNTVFYQRSLPRFAGCLLDAFPAGRTLFLFGAKPVLLTFFVSGLAEEEALMYAQRPKEEGCRWRVRWLLLTLHDSHTHTCIPRPVVAVVLLQLLCNDISGSFLLCSFGFLPTVYHRFWG